MIDVRNIRDSLVQASPGPWKYESGPYWNNLRSAQGEGLLSYTTSDDGVHIDNPADKELIASAWSNARAVLIGNALYDALIQMRGEPNWPQAAEDAVKAWEGLE